MQTPSKDDIEKYLIEFKKSWDGRVLDERQDGKNDETLAILGITPKHRAEIIRGLTYEDYYRGPSPDHSKPSEEIWEFGKRVKQDNVYIKLKIYEINNRKKGKCLSFHIAEKPIINPFRKESD